MIVRLLGTQIPRFWDIIKYALKEVEELGTDQERGVYNHVFAKLMQDKMQCFIIVSNDTIVGVIVTEILENEVTFSRTMEIRAVYAFESQDDKVWRQAFSLVKRAAKQEKCFRVLLNFRNPRIIEIAEANGYKEISRVMELSIGD